MKYLLKITLFFLLYTTSILCKNSGQEQKSDKKITKADSLFSLGKIYSDDSLNQKKALELFGKSLFLYKKYENLPKIAKTYQYIAYAYDYKENYDSVKKYHQKALKINIDIDNKRMAAVSANNLGIAYTITGDLDSAHYYYDKGIDLTKITKDTAEFIELYQNKGICFDYGGDYENAVKYTVKALKYSEKINYINSIVALNLHIAQYYNNIANIEKAFTYCEHASNYIEKISNQETKASFYNTLGEIYFSNSNNKKAKINFSETLKISRKNNYKRGIAAAYMNLAKLYLEEKKLKDAENYAELSVETEKEINDISGIISSLIIFSEIQYLQKHYNKALLNLDEAKKMSKENGIYENLPDIDFHFYNIYKLTGKTKNALKYYERFHKIKDSLNAVEVKEKIADIEIKYQTEKKQHKIELLNEENKTKEQNLKARGFLIASLILLLFLITGAAYFFRAKAFHKLNKMELEIQNYILKSEELNRNISNNYSDNLEYFSKKHQLTERETEVLELICKGKTNAQIAEKIFVSQNTVKYHIKNIYLKMDVKNRVEARNKISG